MLQTPEAVAIEPGTGRGCHLAVLRLHHLAAAILLAQPRLVQGIHWVRKALLCL